MTYASVCSGIESATQAWHPLGWRPAFFAETEPFPAAVLSHRWPGVPNYGDLNLYRDWPLERHGTIDLLVAGTPCQAFSVAGLRAGMADPRGNLALVLLGLVERMRPRWVVWENVPGVHSSWSDAAVRPPAKASLKALEEARQACVAAGLDLGADFRPRQFEEADQSNDFDCFISGLEQLGYGLATRVLDAQHFGVPQRRRRVFVVGHLGGCWQRAAAVLFERECLSGDPAPRRQTGQGTAGTLAARTGGGGRPDGGDGRHDQLIAPTLDASFGRLQGCSGQDANNGRGHLISGTLNSRPDGSGGLGTDFDLDGGLQPVGGISPAVCSKWAKGSGGPAGDECQNLVAFDTTQITSKTNRCQPEPGDPCHPRAAGAHPPALAYNLQSANSNAMRGKGDAEAANLTEVARALDTGRGAEANQGGTIIAFQQQGTNVGEMGTLRAGCGNVTSGVPFLAQDGPVAFHGSQDPDVSGDVTHPVGRNQGRETCVAFQPRIARNGRGDMGDQVNALNAESGRTGKGDAAPCVAQVSDGDGVPETVGALMTHSTPNGHGCAGVNNQQVSSGHVLRAGVALVRRLTPRECERLQGFPDDYTLIPGWGERPRRGADYDETLGYLLAAGFPIEEAKTLVNTPDGHRYRALGNSKAVPVVRWIGRRIQLLEDTLGILSP